MAQMQSEMLAKARFDGGYPRVVVVGLGIIALAKDEKEWNRLRREGEVAHLILGFGLLVAVLAIAVLIWRVV